MHLAKLAQVQDTLQANRTTDCGGSDAIDAFLRTGAGSQQHICSDIEVPDPGRRTQKQPKNAAGLGAMSVARATIARPFLQNAPRPPFSVACAGEITHAVSVLRTRNQLRDAA